MRKSYLLLLSALLLSSSSFAQKVTVKALSLKGNVKSDIQLPVAKLAVDPSDTLISNPSGEISNGNLRSGFKFYSTYSGVSGVIYEYSVGKYVVNGDEVFLFDPFSSFRTGTYIKLTKEGNAYKAKLPQPVYNNSGELLYATRLVLTKTEKSYTYLPDSVQTDAYFSFNDNVLRMADSTYVDSTGLPKVIIGMTNADGGWYGYGESSIVVKPMTETATEIPSSFTKYRLDQTTWNTYGSGDRENGYATMGIPKAKKSLIDVSVGDKYVYINNPATKDPTSWIKGEIVGDTAVVFKKQYIGVDETDGAHLWMIPATYTLATDSSYSYMKILRKYRDYKIADQFVMKYDKAKNTLVAVDSATMLINQDPNEVYQLATVDEAVISPFDEVGATPADPTELYTSETSYADRGYWGFNFELPAEDVDGNLINTSKMTYNIFIDDPENPWPVETQQGLPASYQTNIPYDYTDDVHNTTGNIDIVASGVLHEIYMYSDPADIDSVGVQVTYTGGGESHKSNIVWVKTEASLANAIDAVSANSSRIKAVAYYDVSGRQVAAPKASGLYVKEITFADGTKKGIKFLVK